MQEVDSVDRTFSRPLSSKSLANGANTDSEGSIYPGRKSHDTLSARHMGTERRSKGDLSMFPGSAHMFVPQDLVSGRCAQGHCTCSLFQVDH